MTLKSLRNNPNITFMGLSRETGLGHNTIQNNLNKLQSLGFIKRYSIFKRKTKFKK